MALLSVLHYPDPRLRNVARPVESIDDSIRTIARDMLETMYDEGGIGLAAIQVNIRQRIIVIDLSADRDQPLYLINPEILHAEGAEKMQEGCLSVPEYFDYVERAERIGYRYQDLNGETHEREADGLLAVCIQHEIDHLDGKLFIDYLSNLKQQRLRKKLEKQERQYAQVL
jgi:peptide deformylase